MLKRAALHEPASRGLPGIATVLTSVSTYGIHERLKLLALNG